MTTIQATTLKILESLSNGKAQTGLLDPLVTLLTAEETELRLHEMKAEGLVTFREVSAANGDQGVIRVVDLKITTKGQNTLAQYRP